MSSLPPRTITVVAAVVIRDRRVLMTQRGEGTHLALHWEFPGGKVEEGESPAGALSREIREELGVEAVVGGPFAFNWHDYGEKRILLLTYLTRLEGDPRRVGVRDLGWFTSREIAGLKLPPADGPVLERLEPLID